MPQPPYVLLFEEAAPLPAPPLLISVDGRGALPLFDSAEKADAFLASADFGPDWKPVKVSGAGLVAVLESCRGQVEYVALSPPPAREEGGMKVEMGGLEELIEALQTSPEDDLFGLGDLNQN
ncbi:MAG: hypothetical protein AVDCRST_MAG28-2747 [uncultured Rubrobacteraceae bacterium]|uniref:SseB protein N-terminal domain-containing protein n=1 Tax=uncultured Rubrobacteraceae bacterium TaxID=349277 RepID=A0A6J4R358_9ACTN|nr:MAG: hypothetical protein AVDCRST_MAG28-2747 [uncultured Rubrobacteraceae bacterium]